MTITLAKIGRRFNQEWIFKNIDYRFLPGNKYAILGPNGSGKSTLLNLILGALSPSEGTIEYGLEKNVPVDVIYQYMSFAAPYLDLIEEFTLQETIDFHYKFKALYKGYNTEMVMELLGLAKSQDKPLKYFSSGMKQRTKLALACCTDTPILILDEPTSNLDKQGLSWYHGMMENFTQERLVIIGSNQETEYSFCNHFVQITDFKK
ncbi:MAG: ABC transporter ATP-binding protein [Pedobacter sp.]|nr:MAG: ABC transporter ATP-binding protein [Pedobacter sp.]